MANSSVSIPPELRKRIKRLAAEKDTSQARILEEAVDLLENRWKAKKSQWSENQIIFLRKIEQEVFEEDPLRKKRVSKLLVATPKNIDIEEAIISTWDSGLLE